jgi:hypothetical protein
LAGHELAALVEAAEIIERAMKGAKPRASERTVAR